MPVEVKLRPIHEDMREVAQLFSEAPFRALDSRYRRRFLLTDLLKVRTCMFHADLHLSAGP
jgi:hypothetical protein